MALARKVVRVPGPYPPPQKKKQFSSQWRVCQMGVCRSVFIQKIYNTVFIRCIFWETMVQIVRFFPITRKKVFFFFLEYLPTTFLASVTVSIQKNLNKKPIDWTKIKELDQYIFYLYLTNSVKSKPNAVRTNHQQCKLKTEIQKFCKAAFVD